MLILNHDGTTPIYMQIAQWLEMEILAGNIMADEKVYSQYQLAEMFNINPATAAKGLNLLADNQIVYKKRGLGMFVTEHAREIILTKRKEKTLKKLIQELVAEAKRLHVNDEELIKMIKLARTKGDEKKNDSC
ncbi:MAG TPA: GntR family transcriptional regulator [Bacillus bacterium]|nr:GntR family transcriptional regulator [Bacillus sp. (in: firmicutes)]